MPRWSSRRRFLRLGAAAMTMGGAGCNEIEIGRRDGGPPTPTDGDSQPATETATVTPTATLTPSATPTPTPTLSPTPEPTPQVPKLAAADGNQGDAFGGAVAVDGTTALIGAAGDETPHGDSAGAAYVVTRADGTWTQQAKLTASDGDAGDQFGAAVALAGSVALVGAPRDEDPNGAAAGAAYVFTQSEGEWRQRAKLAPADGEQGDVFGRAVALDDGTALVGAPFDETPNGQAAGAAYVFTRSGGEWRPQAKLALADGSQGDLFGGAVALAGDTALVGAYWADRPAGSRAGAAAVFTRTDGDWSQQTTLTAGDGDAGDEFGWAVALESGTALIGAPRDEDPNGGEAGATYVFTRADGTWRQQAKLTATDGDQFDRVGWAVALDAGTALLGAPRDEDPNGEDAGAAYVFSQSNGTWAPQAKLVPADGDAGDTFGTAVGLTGELALVGAPGDESPNGPGAGATYVFTV